ncbi:MAG TPA: DNA-processing protein DprA [Thermoanaerobaculia bacterium]|nr:DNA-processing protein DprA [Thermoanaerobaculia bacterium]
MDAREYLIALSLLPWVTPNRIRLLRETFEPLDAARHASPELLAALLACTREQAEGIRRPPRATLTNEVVTFVDDDYPPLLRELPDPPLALHYLGDLKLLVKPSIAIVGSRRASPYGINAARHFATALAGASLAVVSGLALGVDAAAHEATLDANGHTIAVLGTGIDLIYPAKNRKLFQRIAAEGVIVTEFPPGTPPKREHFPIRNRIISGLSLGTLIVEATSRSGSLITARTAAEQNREVFAVPGSIFARGSEGTHRLIQYGARLVHEIDDLLSELREEYRPAARLADAEPEPPLREVLAVFTRDEATHIDAAAARLHRTPAELAESLLLLELGGWLRPLPGASYVRAR